MKWKNTILIKKACKKSLKNLLNSKGLSNMQNLPRACYKQTTFGSVEATLMT